MTSVILTFITKTFFTEKIIKAVLLALGDHLVRSSKNKLDDLAWKSIRNTLGK
jgi:hypothetical protein